METSYEGALQEHSRVEGEDEEEEEEKVRERGEGANGRSEMKGRSSACPVSSAVTWLIITAHLAGRRPLIPPPQTIQLLFKPRPTGEGGGGVCVCVAGGGGGGPMVLGLGGAHTTGMSAGWPTHTVYPAAGRDVFWTL